MQVNIRHESDNHCAITMKFEFVIHQSRSKKTEPSLEVQTKHFYIKLNDFSLLASKDVWAFRKALRPLSSVFLNSLGVDE